MGICASISCRTYVQEEAKIVPAHWVSAHAYAWTVSSSEVLTHTHVKGLTCLGSASSAVQQHAALWKCVHFVFTFHRWSSWRSSETKQRLMVFVLWPCWLYFIQSLGSTGASYLIRCPNRVACCRVSGLMCVQGKSRQKLLENNPAHAQ